MLCGPGESGAAELRRSSRPRQAVQPSPPKVPKKGASAQDALAESLWSGKSQWVAHQTHPYLLTRVCGRKRWFRCAQCEYQSDRFYHSRMHYERIHVNHGRSMPGKRKYAALAAGAALPQRHHHQRPAGAARVFTFGSLFFQDEGLGLVLDCAGMRPPRSPPLSAEDSLSGSKRAQGAEGAAEDEDLAYLMPGYSLWHWEKFDLSDLVGGELEHWLRVHNKNATQPPDAVYKEAETRLDLMRTRLVRSRALLDSERERLVYWSSIQ